MTAAAYRVVEWVPACVSLETAIEPILRAMIAQGAGWCCHSLLQDGACRDRQVLVVRGWHERPEDDPPPLTWEEVFPDPGKITREDALRALEREIDRRRGIITTLGQILANTEVEERDLAALRAVHLRLLETPP
jgi:hypothetical protein